APSRGRAASGAEPCPLRGHRDRCGTACLRRSSGGLRYPRRMPSNRVIGVDLGGTKILAGIVDANGKVERHRETPTPLGSQDELLAGLEAAVGELLDGDVAAVGFGIPSPIDQETGRVERSVNIPLGDLDFRGQM